MLFNIFLLVAGLGALVWSADKFVYGAAAFARNLGLPPMLIGDEIRNGQLIHILPDYCSANEDVWLLSPEKKGISRVTRLLIDHLLIEMPKLVSLS